MAPTTGTGRDADARADDLIMLTFTNRGERALDQLAAVITNGMARTPRGIADVLAKVYRTPLDELAAALDSIAAGIEREVGAAFICGPCRDGRHSACDDSERRPDYPGCCCQHKPATQSTPARRLDDSACQPTPAALP